METWDVLVVGGGPAGSACARELAAAGARVAVVDKARFPRPKVCAGWVTPQVLAALGIDPEAYGAGRVLQPFTGFRTAILGGRPVTTRYEGPVSYGILRTEFDDHLLRRSGARLLLGEPVLRLERSGDLWVVNQRLRAPLVVGAGGHFCPVARALGARGGAVVAAQELEFPLDPEAQARCPVDPEVPELYFTPDLKGYGWCLRKGAVLNVGLGREDPVGLPRHMEAFVAFLSGAGRLPDALPGRPAGHAYRLWGRGPRRLAFDGALLVGDAAGLAYPESGEGIRPAVESGLLAARTALEAEGDYRRERLRVYEQRIARRLGPPRTDEGLASRMPGGLLRLAARSVLGIPTLTRRVVLDRWFLRSHLAPLAPTASGPASAATGG
ncbi:MAG: hypothetical protein Kow0092_36830 [Deferrisomatales bacterium]